MNELHTVLTFCPNDTVGKSMNRVCILAKKENWFDLLFRIN